MNYDLIHIGNLQTISTQIKSILVRVDERGEIICNYTIYGGSQAELEEYLGGPTRFEGVKEYKSKAAEIQIVALYPGQELPQNMRENKTALLVFDYDSNMQYPHVILQFTYHSYVGQPEKFKRKFDQFTRDDIPLGEGSFGTVYKVQEKTTQQYYAMKAINIARYIKQIKNEFNSEVARKKLVMETILQQKVKSEYVIYIQESFDNESDFYIIMELASKNDFQTYISSQKEPFQVKEIRTLMVQLCKAIQAMHQCNIIHRDLKPENFVFCNNNILKLIDFGLARESIDASTFCGTLQYMAPEVLKKQLYSNKADIFSLGCIFYYLLTLELAFTGQGQVQIIDQILSDEPKCVKNQLYPLEIVELCNQMLCKNPDERPTIDNILKIFENIDLFELNEIYEIEQQIIQEVVKVVNDVDQVISQFNNLSQKCEDVKTELDEMLQMIVMQIEQDNKKVFGKKIDTEVFIQISEIIIYNLLFNQKEILLDEKQMKVRNKEIRNEFQYLKDNFTTVKNITVMNQNVSLCFGEHKTNRELEYKKVVFADGTVKIGLFTKCGLGGIGREVSKNGDRSLCQYHNNMRSGFGRINCSNGNIIECQWNQNKMQGLGKIINKNGYQYEGMFVDNKKHGVGLQYYVNKDIYKGDWLEDKRCGNGILLEEEVTARY